MVEIVLWFMLGAVIGAIVANLMYMRDSGFGVLKVDKSNPEKDVYRFDIYDLDGLAKRKYVTLRVDKTADLSQK